jgi:UDP-glucose 4-epimerase
VKVLVTGVSSKVANLVALRLLEDGHTVIGVDRRPWPDAPASVEMHEVDLRKRGAEEVFRKSRPDAVIHMATVTHLVKSSDERYRINLGGTRAVFDFSRAYGVKQIIFVGRHTYYGAAPDAPLYHGEDDPPMAMSSFPELSDLVAADLYATTALWRAPDITTSVLRICYTLGPSGTGTLCAYLAGARVPSILGFDPLFQFIHEHDVARAISLALTKQIRGVFNVAGPQPVPLSVLVRGTGRKPMPIPEFLFNALLGRFGLPRLPPGALAHIKHPVVIDGAAFRAATGFTYERDEIRTMQDFAAAFPPPERGSKKRARAAR